jgi:hypothetical protein
MWHVARATFQCRTDHRLCPAPRLLGLLRLAPPPLQAPPWEGTGGEALRAPNQRLCKFFLHPLRVENRGTTPSQKQSQATSPDQQESQATPPDQEAPGPQTAGTRSSGATSSWVQQAPKPNFMAPNAFRRRNDASTVRVTRTGQLMWRKLSESTHACR